MNRVSKRVPKGGASVGKSTKAERVLAIVCWLSGDSFASVGRAFERPAQSIGNWVYNGRLDKVEDLQDALCKMRTQGIPLGENRTWIKQHPVYEHLVMTGRLDQRWETPDSMKYKVRTLDGRLFKRVEEALAEKAQASQVNVDPKGNNVIPLETRRAG